MQLKLLGEVELWPDHGPPLALPATKARLVLAVLGLELNQVVSVQRLLDLIWDRAAPQSARTALQIYVSGLRKLLDPTLRLVTRPPGYMLQASSELVDVHRFRKLVASATSETPQLRIELLREALGLWRGPPLPEAAGHETWSNITMELEESRFEAVEMLAEQLLAIGSGREIVTELRDVLAIQPLRESTVALLMLCLHQAARQAEAFDVYHHARQLLADELGVDPGPALRAAYEEMLHATTEVPGSAAPEPTAGDPPQKTIETAQTYLAVPAQLPRETTGFVGRQLEISWLEEQNDRHDLGAGGIFMVVGPPGVGKTSLVMRWAHQVAETFDGGQLFVNLRGFDETEPLDAGIVLGRFLRTLGVVDSLIPKAADERAALYRTLLANRRVLVVLDNAASASQVRPLLPGGPHCAVVVTSRHRLDALITNEGARVLVVESLGRQEALDLLTLMIGELRVRAELAAARQLVTLCDCLPLALRVASARLTGGTPRSIQGLVDELVDEHARVEALATDDTETSIAAALNLSYRHLDDDAAKLFVLLSIYAAPDIDEYAATALGGLSRVATRRALAALVAAHLLIETAGGRYTRHDLVRLYSREVAATALSGAEFERALARILDYYLDVSGAARRLVTSADHISYPAIEYPPVAVPRFDNPNEAVDWFEHQQSVIATLMELGNSHHMYERVWKLTENTARCNWLRGTAIDWMANANAGLVAARRLGDRLSEVTMLRSKLFVAFEAMGDVEEAGEIFEEALGVVELIPDSDQRAISLRDLLSSAVRALPWDRWEAMCHEALAMSRHADEPFKQSHFLGNVARSLQAQGQSARALPYVEEALQLDDKHGLAASRPEHLRTYANVLQDLGRIDGAIAAYEATLQEAHAAGDHRTNASCLYEIAKLLFRVGRTAQAEMYWMQASDLYRSIGQAPPMDPRGEHKGSGPWRRQG